MAAYRRVYDSRHLQAGCQEPGSAPEPLGNRVWATLTFLVTVARKCAVVSYGMGYTDRQTDCSIA